jgi:RNA polymerase sigma-70 factor (ECF subfamily)
MVLRLVRKRADAEDIVHEAFIRAATRAHQYRNEQGTLRAWLFAIAKNLGRDHLRRGHRRTRLASATVESRYDEAFSSRRGSPESLIVLAQERQQLLRLLAAVGHSDQQLLRALYWEGLSFSQVAVQSDLPIGTLKSRVSRALGRMRRRASCSAVAGAGRTSAASCSRRLPA